MEYQEIKEGVLELCEASFVEVFQNQGCLIYRSLESHNFPVNYRQPIVIDAKAPELELVMSLSIPQEILVASYPSKEEVETLDDELLLDWGKELANRLMGALKNRVIAGTSAMALGIPAVQLNDELFQGGDVEQLTFESEGVAFGCKLGLRVRGEIETFEQPEVDCMDGELEFF